MNMQLLLSFSVLLASAHLSLQAHVHGHNHKHGKEREEDGAYSPRDHGHFGGDEHNVEFDHEAILGNQKDAEEFDHLPPEEAKKRLSTLLLKMDLNNDQHISRTELKQWILRSFRSLSEEESLEKMQEVDQNKDEEVTWIEYLSETYGIEGEAESNMLSGKEHSDEERLLKNDKELFETADVNKNGRLDKMEFLAFTHPEEAPHMLETILKQTLEDKDLNKDGVIDFQEYIGERDFDIEIEKQKEMFDKDYDTNGDGHLDSIELKRWVAPSNDEIAEEEVDHLYASSDDDHDNLLSFKEILDHHDIFVGSEATDYGEHLTNIHRFQDEL